MTRRTLAEITAIATRAARGAGCPWGLAEEAGMAVRTLEAHDIPGGEALARVLSTPRVCKCTDDTTGPVCGIAAAAALSDQVSGPLKHPLEFGPVIGAELMAGPLILAAQETGAFFRMCVGDATFAISPQGVAHAGRPPPVGAVRVETVDRGETPRAASCKSRDVPDAVWEVLEDLAARTLVPESDLSRDRGAGPAQDDGD